MDPWSLNPSPPCREEFEVELLPAGWRYRPHSEKTGAASTPLIGGIAALQGANRLRHNGYREREARDREKDRKTVVFGGGGGIFEWTSRQGWM